MVSQCSVSVIRKLRYVLPSVSCHVGFNNMCKLFRVKYFACGLKPKWDLGIVKKIVYFLKKLLKWLKKLSQVIEKFIFIFRTTILVLGSLLDTFQKIADAASNTRGKFLQQKFF